MSLFTQIRNFALAPIKSFNQFDPIAHKLTTGHFSLSLKGYKQRTAAGVHELYSQDRLAQKLGIKESSVVKVATVAGYIVAIYFTAGATSGAFSGGTGAGAGGGAGVGTATTTTGLTAGDVYQGLTLAQALSKASQQKKAASAAELSNQQAQIDADTAAKNAEIVGASQPASSQFTAGHLLAILAAAAALL